MKLICLAKKLDIEGNKVVKNDTFELYKENNIRYVLLKGLARVENDEPVMQIREEQDVNENDEPEITKEKIKRGRKAK
jgi:hypothetical protein